MKNKPLVRNGLIIIALIVLIISIYSMTNMNVYAVSETGRDGDYDLMEGVTESTVYVTDSGKENVRVHILRVLDGANVSLKATYEGYYGKGTTEASRAKYASEWSAKKWDLSTLKDQAKAYNKSGDVEGTVIAASSGDFYSKEDGEKGYPFGKLIMEGNVVNDATGEPFFAVMKDGTYAILDGDADTTDVEEAVAGGSLLVKGGKVLEKKGGGREPRQAIGITADGTVVIVNVDGRDPVSPGTSNYDLANIMKQQGCVDALNFDGGGSATFLTKRSGDSSLVYRNIAGDGFERKVSSSLLVVKNKADNGKEVTGDKTVSMTNSKTALTKSSGTYKYKINGKNQTGFFIINGKTYLFKSGKGLSKSVKIGNTTYTFKKGALTKASDAEAGTVHIGYCGAIKSEENMIYAYQRGNGVLNVGLNPLYGKKNGKMKDWSGDNSLTLPWYASRSEIKKVYIADGVTTIGDRFLHVASIPIFDGSMAPTGVLTSVRLPKSLKTIGANAFYNKPKLKSIWIPKTTTNIDKNAFGATGVKTIKYEGTKAQWKKVKGSGKKVSKAKVKYKIAQPKDENPMSVTAKDVTVKYSKSKDQTVKRSAALTISSAKGTVTYAKKSGNKSITVSKAGVITLKKGLKKGTYSVKVKVTAAGTKTYDSLSKTVTVKITVK